MLMLKVILHLTNFIFGEYFNLYDFLSFKKVKFKSDEVFLCLVISIVKYFIKVINLLWIFIKRKKMTLSLLFVN